MKWLSAAVVALVLTAAGTAVWIITPGGEKCFHYDVLVDSYVICGTPSYIEQEQERRGKEMRDAYVGEHDPETMCLERAEAQSYLNSWPNEYREAYERGCKER
jgi:hypothetical protein